MIQIAGRELGKGNCFIIAELSANHSKNLDIALETIEAVSKTGADAIKLQTVDPDKITINCDNKYFYMPSETAWGGKSLYQLEIETFLPKEWHLPLFNKARECGLICFSSPFDLDAIDFLEELNCPAYKIASFEITDTALIKKAASTGKPVIISTGIAYQEDIKLAVDTCLENNNDQIILLKCTSAYPTPLDQVDLKSMPKLGDNYNCLYGISDHTIGESIPMAAVALGASMIEKHIKLDQTIKSADDFFSMDVDELKDMVKKIRNIELSLGSNEWRITKSMLSGRKICRSLFVTENIKKGEKFTYENLRSIRAGNGLHPKFLDQFIDKQSLKDIERGTPLDWSMIETQTN